MIEKYSLIFKALSDKTRLRIIHLLLWAGLNLCVCEIVDSLGESQYNVSKHLKELKYADLIEEKKMGKWVSYGLKSSPDDFKKKIFEAIASMPDEVTTKDKIRLEARLGLRKEGKCVIGFKSEQWAAVLKKITKIEETDHVQKTD